MLPILTVLFLISYGLMTLLIVEQGNTIQSQRTMIRQLLGDSQELSAMKAKASALSRQAQDRNQAQAPAVQTPSTQEPATQAAPSAKARNDHGGKVQRPSPSRPPKNASEMVDARRNLLSI
jgi:hypothetical protein